MLVHCVWCRPKAHTGKKMSAPAQITRGGSNHKQGRRQLSGTGGYTSPPIHVTVVPPTSTLVVAAAKGGPGRHHPHAGNPDTEPGGNQGEIADQAIVTTEGGRDTAEVVKATRVPRPLRQQVWGARPCAQVRQPTRFQPSGWESKRAPIHETRESEDSAGARH